MNKQENLNDNDEHMKR